MGPSWTRPGPVSRATRSARKGSRADYPKGRPTCKIIAIEHLTLDGVVQAPGNPDEDRRDGFRHGGWANRRQDPVMQQVIGERMSTPYRPAPA
jgi:hypothetical protein